MSIAVWKPTNDSEEPYVLWYASKNDYDSESSHSSTVTLYSNSNLTGTREICEKSQVSRSNTDSTMVAAEDMTSLGYLEEPNLLHCLDQRYTKDKVYSSIAGVLVAVNPYKKLDIYGSEDLTRYRDIDFLPGAKPHVFWIAENAYRHIIKTVKNQSVICCGESGSGKTESTKMLMRYLTTRTGHSTDIIEQQVLQTNPITEAFGNARTQRNNNSSRFAKFIKLFVSPKYSKDPKDPKYPTGSKVVKSADRRIVGSHTETYLLERSRITGPPKGERNFHVFYQLCAAAKNNSDLRKKFSLESAEQFQYLNAGGQVTVKGMDDQALFKELCESLETLQFDVKTREYMFAIVSAILHLGEFDCKDPGSEASRSAGKISAALLGLESKNLVESILTRNIHVSSEEIYNKTLDHLEATANRDAIAKVLYNSLFNWIISRINKTLFDTPEESSTSPKSPISPIDPNGPTSPKSPTNALQWIGILDVFGFESFDHNSYEQFCINFANERLQNFFNDHILKSEQEEYRREAIYWQDVPIQDNDHTIALIDGKPSGIFSLLDSACIMPNGTATVFQEHIFTLNKGHLSLCHLDIPRTVKKYPGFAIRHYAGKVQYNCEQFLAKNDDSLHPDVLGVFAHSNSPLVAELFQQSTGPGSKVHRFKSIGRTFTAQLDRLVKNLKATTPYFVRCLNPNSIMVPNDFRWGYVQPQVRCGGLIETLRVLKYGYPFRVPYTLITEQYINQLGFSQKRIDCTCNRNLCEAILRYFGQNGKGLQQYQLGLTKVFFKSGKQDLLEKIEEHAKKPLTVEFKRSVVKWLIKRRWDRLRGIVKFRIRTERLLKILRTLYALRKFIRSIIRIQQFLRNARKKALALTSLTSLTSKSKTQSTKQSIVVGNVFKERELEDKIHRTQAEKALLEKQAQQLLREKEDALELAKKTSAAKETALVEQESSWRQVLSAKQEEVEDLTRQNQKHQRTLEALIQKESEQAEILRQKDEEYEETQRNVQLIQNQLQNLQKEVQDKTEAFAEKQRELKQLADQERELEALLNSRTQEYTQRRQEFDQLIEIQQSEFRKKESELEDLKRQHERRLKEDEKRLKKLAAHEQQKRDDVYTMYSDEISQYKEVYESQIRDLRLALQQTEAMLKKRDATIEQFKENQTQMEYESKKTIDVVQSFMQKQIDTLIRKLEASMLMSMSMSTSTKTQTKQITDHRDDSRKHSDSTIPPDDEYKTIDKPPKPNPRPPQRSRSRRHYASSARRSVNIPDFH